MRLQSIDIARGVAIVLMVIFHFIFDLTTFGLSSQDFYTDPFWLHARTLIVTLFLTLVGISFSLASENGISKKRFLTRQRNLFFCLLLVSISTYIVSKDRFIFFGILHFIFVASFLNILFRKFYYLNLVFGVFIVVLGNYFASLVFHTPWLKWVGFQTFKPPTDDYAPLFPWYGVVLIGLFLGKLILLIRRPEPKQRMKTWTFPTLGSVAFLGRHALLIYMIHQPILIGLLFLYTKFIR